MTEQKRDLNELKVHLWAQFDKAIQRQRNYKDHDQDYSRDYHPSNFAIQGRQSIALLAQAIIALETEQRRQAEVQEQSSRRIPKTSGSSLKTVPEL